VRCLEISGSILLTSRSRESLGKWNANLWLFPEGLEAGIVAEHLLNNRLQMRAFSANAKVVILTKQTKIGLCEQVGCHDACPLVVKIREKVRIKGECRREVTLGFRHNLLILLGEPALRQGILNYSKIY
jgi:hypothetical protein